MPVCSRSEQPGIEIPQNGYKNTDLLGAGQINASCSLTLNSTLGLAHIWLRQRAGDVFPQPPPPSLLWGS